MISLLDAEDREEREAELKQHRAEREESLAEEKAVAEWFDDVQAVADAAMIAAEFHKQKNQSGARRRAAAEIARLRGHG